MRGRAQQNRACLHTVQGLEGVLPLTPSLHRRDERREGAAVGLATAQPHLLEQVLRLLPVPHCGNHAGWLERVCSSPGLCGGSTSHCSCQELTQRLHAIVTEVEPEIPRAVLSQNIAPLDSRPPKVSLQSTENFKMLLKM